MTTILAEVAIKEVSSLEIVDKTHDIKTEDWEKTQLSLQKSYLTPFAPNSSQLFVVERK